MEYLAFWQFLDLNLGATEGNDASIFARYEGLWARMPPNFPVRPHQGICFFSNLHPHYRSLGYHKLAC